LVELTQAEGTYEFRAVATFGEDCRATREAHWSIHVEPGIDPDCTSATLVDVTTRPDGRHGTLVIRPCDRYGNPFGPGRGDKFTVTPWPGVTLDGRVVDNGDGSYSAPVAWDPDVLAEPGVLVGQPDRPPAPVSPSGSTPTRPCPDCGDAAEKLLDCLGLPAADVKRVRIKSVNVEIDLDERDCGKRADC
jgi:hypothetical protein